VPADHAVPVERHGAIERVKHVGEVAVGEVAEADRLDGDVVHGERELVFRQQDEERIVRVIAPRVVQLDAHAAELDGAELVHRLVGDHDVGVAQRLEPRLRVAVRDDRGAGLLEGLAAGDMVVVVMAVDQILDRRLRDLADLREIRGRCLRPQERDRVGGDHAFRRHHEQRLVELVAEQEHVVGQFARFE
jgi:hypothetical protein